LSQETSILFENELEDPLTTGNSAGIDSLRYELVDVKINDSFWSPKLQLWQTKTVNDVFDKFEGRYKPQGQWLEKDFEVLGTTRNFFLNFDLVAAGKRDIVRGELSGLGSRMV
jgi:hypothetical protein